MTFGPITIRSQSLTVPGYCTPPPPLLHPLPHPHCADHPLEAGQRSPRGRAAAPGHGRQLRWHSPGPGTSLHPSTQYSPRARQASTVNS